MSTVFESEWSEGAGVPQERPYGTIDVTPDFAAAFAKMTPEEQQALMAKAQKNELARFYGSYAAFFEIDEVRAILIKAAQLGYTPSRLRQDLEQTEWWARTTRSQNQYDAFAAANGGVDGATMQKLIGDKASEIGDVSAGLGMRLSDEQTRSLAQDALRNGLNERELQSAIAAEMRKSPDSVQTLRVGQVGRDVRRLAADYGVPLADSTLDTWMNGVLDGKYTTTDFENYLRQQASSLYPSLANEINRGINVKTFADPYRQLAAQTLGITPEDINFADPKWNAALNFDDGKGRRAMTLYEWGRHLRTEEQYGYDRTPEATNKAYEMVDRLGRMFGVTA